VGELKTVHGHMMHPSLHLADNVSHTSIATASKKTNERVYERCCAMNENKITVKFLMQ